MRDWEALVPVGILVLLVLLVSGVFWASKAEAQWREWADVHCQVVAIQEGYSTVLTTVGMNGQVMVTPLFHPDRVTYQCDDGLLHTR